MTITNPPQDFSYNKTAGFMTPSLAASKDLQRFPTESLHSFSFSHRSEESIHTRHDTLKRSIDFLQGRTGWAAGGLGIAHAQARVDGSQEVQSMMELLSRANLLGVENFPARVHMGPLTGPAEISVENIFEQTFETQSESPTSTRIPTFSREAQEEIEQGRLDTTIPVVTLKDNTAVAPTNTQKSSLPHAPFGAPFVRPGLLKRTFTDIEPLSLQRTLTDVLSQPYMLTDKSLLSPTSPLTLSIPSALGSAFPSSVPHSHGRGAPASQAIFTTESQEPWTITAANDLACLIFGIHKADLRKTGILEVIRDDKRKWLEEKLRGADTKVQTPTSPRRTPSPNTNLIMGNGVTARLLSRPSSRETGKGRRAKIDGSNGSNVPQRNTAQVLINNAPKSRGVLLCGDVVPILKRNGAIGSTTLWLQEKRGSLIWVMEEIAEDVAYLTVDEVGCVNKVTGASDGVWGMERVRRGMDITRLLPAIPRRKGTNTGALDYDEIAKLRRFTARTANDISVPVSVDRISGSNESTFRVSSFPYIAGMVFVSASTLKVTTSNTAVSEALFGRVPNGLPMTDLIPNFDRVLELLVEEEGIQLVEGMVISEHSFRRARAMLAIREGKGDAAAVFLRPSGLPAKHRDGAEIMVDVQMRVVKSEVFGTAFEEHIIVEKVEGDESEASGSSSELFYALWITYSRMLHAVNHGIGPFTPLVSRPGTPPRQPSPGQTVTTFTNESDSEMSNTSRHPSHTLEGNQELESTNDDKATRPHTNSQIPIATDGTTDTSTSTDGSSKRKSISDFVILEDMGAGAYGQVKLARPKSDPNSSAKVVIKYVTKRRILVDTWTRDRRLGTVPLEIHVLDYLRRDGFKHVNIVEMADFFEDDTNYYIEMIPHGLPGMDLFDYIELRVNMEEDECRKIFAQVAAAVGFLHGTAKVVHRDIKDENVVLDGEGNVKLIDFGSASYIKNGPFDVFVGTIGRFYLPVCSFSAYPFQFFVVRFLW